MEGFIRLISSRTQELTKRSGRTIWAPPLCCLVSRRNRTWSGQLTSQITSSARSKSLAWTPTYCPILTPTTCSSNIWVKKQECLILRWTIIKKIRWRDKRQEACPLHLCPMRNRRDKAADSPPIDQECSSRMASYYWPEQTVWRRVLKYQASLTSDLNDE